MEIDKIGEVANELAGALGIKGAKKIDIHFEAVAGGAIATVEAEFYPVIDNVRNLPTIIKKFKLVPVDEGN